MSERVRRLLPDVVYLLLYFSGVYTLVLWPPIQAGVQLAAGPLLARLGGAIDGIPLLARCAIALAAADALAYWMHRAAHANPWLWRLHRVHHSAPSLNVLTTFRFHFLEIAWRMALQYLPLYLLGVAASIPPAAIFALLAFNVLAHSSLDWDLGFLGRAVVSPAYHGTHHREERANYGMYLTVWDSLFGTRR